MFRSEVYGGEARTISATCRGPRTGDSAERAEALPGGPARASDLSFRVVTGAGFNPATLGYEPYAPRLAGLTRPTRSRFAPTVSGSHLMASQARWVVFDRLGHTSGYAPAFEPTRPPRSRARAWRREGVTPIASSRGSARSGALRPSGSVTSWRHSGFGVRGWGDSRLGAPIRVPHGGRQAVVGEDSLAGKPIVPDPEVVTICA